MRRLILFTFIFIILFANLSEAKEAKFTTEQNIPVDIFEDCERNGFECGSLFACNITIIDSNETKIVVNKQMTRIDTEYNYTLNSSDVSNLGFYQYSIFCTNGTAAGHNQNFIEVTPSGFSQNTSQGLISIAVLFVVFLMGIVFIVKGFILTGHKDFWFMGILLIGIGLALFIYTLTMSVVYTRDLSYTSGTAIMQEKIFSRFMGFIKLLAICFGLFMIIFARNNIKHRKEKQSANDGWDNNLF